MFGRDKGWHTRGGAFDSSQSRNRGTRSREQLEVLATGSLCDVSVLLWSLPGIFKILNDYFHHIHTSNRRRVPKQWSIDQETKESRCYVEVMESPVGNIH